MKARSELTFPLGGSNLLHTGQQCPEAIKNDPAPLHLTYVYRNSCNKREGKLERLEVRRGHELFAWLKGSHVNRLQGRSSVWEKSWGKWKEILDWHCQGDWDMRKLDVQLSSFTHLAPVAVLLLSGPEGTNPAGVSHKSLSGPVPWERCPCRVKSRGATLALSTAWLAVPASEFGRDKDVQLPLLEVECISQCFFLDRVGCFFNNV